MAVAGFSLGMVLLASIGTAQWLILRTEVPRAQIWIGLAGGLLMAVTTSAITAIAIRRLVGTRHDPITDG